MRNLDPFSPLRSDGREPSLEPEDRYPPCNIVRTGENTYRISLAVADGQPMLVPLKAAISSSE